MKELWKDKKFWIVFAAELLFIFLSAYFIFRPLVKGIISKADKIQETKIDRELLSARLSKIGESRNEHQKLASGVSKMDVLLGPEEEVDFFKELEQIAAGARSEVSFKIIEEAKKDVKSTIPTTVLEKEKKEMLDSLSYKNYFILQINLEGDYHGLVNFLHKLENLDHYLTVISIDAQKVKESLAGELAPAGEVAVAPKEIEKINSLITVAVYRK